MDPEPSGPVDKAALVEPGGRPVAAVCSDQGVEVPSGFLHRGARVGREKTEGHGTQAEFEEPASAGRLEVVVPLRRSLGDDRDLALVQAQVAVERRLGRCRGIRVGQIDLRHARVDDRVPVRQLGELGRALRGQDDRGVLLPQLQEPLIHPGAEE